jgi:RNA polymerase sigma-70 factor (ECF subfamily)
VKDESDGVLLRRVLGGETREYAKLVDRYRDRLGRYALRMLGNEADAEDAVQDTFIRAYRSLARCQGDAFGPWVFGILVNRCRTYASRRIRIQSIMVNDEAAIDMAAVASTEGREALRDALYKAMEGLPADQREAFLLRHVEDLSYETMEAMTGVRAATLRMRVFRARDELRKLLAETVRD